MRAVDNAAIRLRFGSQGRYRAQFERAMVKASYHGRRSSEPRPRTPWDPQAVSDPRLVADELHLVVHERASGAEGSRPAPLKDPALLPREPMEMVRTLPRQIYDHETGEDFDVIGDDDMPPYPSRAHGGSRGADSQGADEPIRG